MSLAEAMASASPISVVMAASRVRFRVFANVSQAASRRAIGAITLSTPYSVTPRRMKGATLAGRSMPWARPQAATAPP